MENYIVKFKHDLKKEQISRKEIIKESENELALIERIINQDPTVINKINTKEKFQIIQIFYSVNQIILTIINNKEKKKNRQKALELLKSNYELFSNFVEYMKKEYTITRNIINAFESDKIKDPINDVNELYSKIKYTSLTAEETSKIIGITILFNSQYASKHKNHHIKNIDIINKLTQYYNQDGSFKYNEDIATFQNLIESLFEENPIESAIYLYATGKKSNISVTDLINLLKSSNEKLKNSNTQTPTKEKIQKESYELSSKTIKALQELRKYYKNGTIIEIPKNLEEFYRMLEDCELDEKEKLYIINLIEQKILEKKNNILSKYLTIEEKNIYEESIRLLSTLNHNNYDTYTLKQYIEELQTIFNMLEENLSEEDRKYLLNDITNIIVQLSQICDKYSAKDYKSSNKYIFLLNKDNIPYIIEDINLLYPIYKKAIYSLIPKIDKINQSQFKKILSNEQLPYIMYEVYSPKAHIAFIEIDYGIYVIVGANIARTGYKKLINRLKSNQSILQNIEDNIKNSQTRNQILKENETYLDLFTENKNNPKTKNNKLTLKLKRI